MTTSNYKTVRPLRTAVLGLGVLALASTVVACDSDGEDTTGDEVGASMTAADATSGGSAGTGGTGTASGTSGDATGGDATGGVTCPDLAQRQMQFLSTADVQNGARLDCNTTYVINSHVFVESGELYIGPGTHILGQPASALVINQGAYINSAGTPELPVVMTSFNQPGQRARGDWGGLVLLGDAPINIPGGVGKAEGFEFPPSYGGMDAAHNCGSLMYTRVEWAGFALNDGNELNGVTFFGCGTQTKVSHLQVHMGKDDGVEFFGGGFNVDHVIVTGAADDSIDIDQGFNGNLQHILIVQDPAVGDNGFEISNNGDVFNATPYNHPRIANATVIGSGGGAMGKSKGFTLKEGTQATIWSSIFVGQTNETILFTHTETEAHVANGGINIANNFFFGAGVPALVVGEGATLDLNGLVAPTNMLATDAGLMSTAWQNVNATPTNALVNGKGVAADAGGLQDTGYAGAVDPANANNWTVQPWINYSVSQ